MNIAERPPIELAEQPGRAAERRRIIVTFVVSCAFMMQGMDQTILTNAIPVMADDLNVTAVTLHFTITAYITALAVFMPVSGWFADRFGTRTVFVGSVVLYALCGVACALVARNLPLLIACRMLQGCCGAVMTPMARLILLRTFGEKRVLDAMSLLSMTTLFGPLAAPLIAGVMLNFLPWRLVFIATTPLCLGAVLGALRYIEPDGPPRPAPFDFPGFFMVGTALILFQLGVENLTHPLIGTGPGIGAFVAFLLLGWTYLRYARRKEDPALDVTLFHVQEFRVGVIGGSIARTGINAIQFLLPLLLQVGFGFSPLVSGGLTFCLALGSLTGKAALRRMVQAIGYRAMLFGLTLGTAILMAGLCLFDAPLMVHLFIAYIVVFGMLRSLQFNAINALTYVAVPKAKLSRGVASGGLFQQLSQALGTSLASVTLAMTVGYDAAPSLADFLPTFLAMGIIPLFALPMIWRLNPDVGRKMKS
jgi:MFS family permease